MKQVAGFVWPLPCVFLGALAACGSPAADSPSGSGNDAGSAGTGPSAGGTGSGTGGSASSGGPSSGGTSSGGTTSTPRTCAEAAPAYTLETTPLDASFVPGGAGGRRQIPELPVAVAPDGSAVYVAFTQQSGATFDTVVAQVGGSSFTVPGSVVGGVAATASGAGALVFDPNSTVSARLWAKVVRAAADGAGLVETDLFRSSNLDDEGTKGEPQSGRLGYVPESDLLVAYFGHTQRYDDGVRHQGGYLATVDAAGEQNRLNGWFGSHNLDQRLVAYADGAAVIGLGDAYPEGIFFSYVRNNPRPDVLYALAAAGNGATNGQLGGMVDLGDSLLMPFITNNSIPQDLDAGTWPDIDEAISQQIRDAAANGTDLGLLVLPKTGQAPDGQLTAIWLDPARPDGARLQNLKSARYGSGDLVLLAWVEASGQGNAGSQQAFTMVVDRTGAVCQSKTPLGAEYGFTSGDDIVSGPDGKVRWANRAGGGVQLVTLTPG
jgi:hypothetical protein